jgi:hypothetical protein
VFVEGDGSGGEPKICESCKQPIWGDWVQIINTNIDGLYHPSCAKPLLSVLRALAILQRNPWS